MQYSQVSYRFAEEVMNSRLALKNEIDGLLQSYTGKMGKGSGAHEELLNLFAQKGWKKEHRVCSDSSLTIDLFKERIGIEIELSHSMSLFKDFLKFQMGFNADEIDIGIIVTHNQESAKRLFGYEVANIEKARKELESLRLVISVPIWVIGLRG